MPKLDDTLETVIQRTGSTSGNPVNEAEAAAFRAGIRLDVASVMNQMNNVYHPLFDTLSKVTQLDALDFGLSGNVIFTHINATAADADAYWDSTQGRVRTVRETVDVLLSELADLENQITSAGSETSGYDDTALSSSVGTNQLNLTQLRRDTVGENYTFDNDGLADNNYPLAQHIEALGQFFTGFPGVGLTYPAAYPVITLSVDLSDVNLDTTIPITNVANLATQITNVGLFTGMTSPLDNSPTYSAHGALTHVSDGQDLELAIYTLDAAFAGFSSTFGTAVGVTSNSGGTYASDDFVFGSPSLDDTGTAAEDSRITFDKSTAAFRAGCATGTQWDLGNRGSRSFAWGVDTVASGIGAYAGGSENQVLANAAAIFAGGGAGIGSSINGTSDYSIVLGGQEHVLTGSQHSLVGVGDAHSIVTSDYSAILSGRNNLIDSTADFNIILGGGHNLAPARNLITGSSSYSAILHGHNGTIDDSDYSLILNGQSGTIDTGVGADHNVIISADSATIGNGTDTGSNNMILIGANGTAIQDGGSFNLASGNSATITGATTDYAVSIGRNASVEEAHSAIIGGQNGRVHSGANHSFIAAGEGCEVFASHAVALGQNARARYSNALSLGNGQINSGGHLVQWSADTTDAVATEMFLTLGGADQLTLEDSRAYSFDIRIVAHNTSTGDVADYTYTGLIKRGVGAATTTLVWSNLTVNHEDVAAWTVNVTADTTNGALKLEATGTAATNIGWQAMGTIIHLS